MKLGDAAAYPGVSAAKVSRLVGAGQLRCSADPLDLRRKLVLASDLDRIREQSLSPDGEG